MTYYMLSYYVRHITCYHITCDNKLFLTIRYSYVSTHRYCYASLNESIVVRCSHWVGLIRGYRWETCLTSDIKLFTGVAL